MRACCRARSFFLRCLRSRPRPVARAVFSCTACKCSQQLSHAYQDFALLIFLLRQNMVNNIALQKEMFCAASNSILNVHPGGQHQLLEEEQTDSHLMITGGHLWRCQGIDTQGLHVHKHKSNSGCRRSVCAHHCVCALLQLNNRLCLGALGLLDGLGHLHCLRAEQTQVSIQFTASIVHHNGRRLGRSYNI